MALTNEQERALTLLRQGLTTAQVAERLGVSRPTVWRWQNELPEFAPTAPASSERGSERRARLTLRELVRVVVALLIILLAALFFYLGYSA